MRACIHGGAASIGASCVELEFEGQHLVLDLGLPLDASAGSAVTLPAIRGLREASDSLHGVVISHNHPDHAGLLDQIDPAVAVFGPAQAQEMLRAASRLAGRAYRAPRWRPLADQVPLELGPFTVTPLLTDHSAFENYALLVEAGGRRLLYSGDLRGHGRKPRLWRRLIDHPPRPVHAFVMEGTRLSRPSGRNITEPDVEEGLTALYGQTRGMVMVFYSAQNIDRLVSVFRATKRADRLLVLDLYGAAVAAATGRMTVPQPDWHRIRVLLPHAQRRRIEHGQEALEDYAAMRENRIYHRQLAAQASNLVLTMRGSMTREIERARCLEGSAAVWSMWPGYLTRPGGARVSAWLERHEIPLTYLHASGHASVEDLKLLAESVSPDRLIPIHTEAPDQYRQLYPSVEQHIDGEWWSV